MAGVEQQEDAPLAAVRPGARVWPGSGGRIHGVYQPEGDGADARHSGTDEIFFSSDEIQGSVLWLGDGEHRHCCVLTQDAGVRGTVSVHACVWWRGGGGGGDGRGVAWGVVVGTEYARS